MSLIVAPGQDVATSEWFSVSSLGAGLRDYVTVLGGVTGWAIFGTTLAVVFRSVPLALGVGFAWAGPFENIIVDSWTAGYRYFPGQVLASLIQGGTTELGIGRAVVTALDLRQRGRRRHPWSSSPGETSPPDRRLRLAASRVCSCVGQSHATAHSACQGSPVSRP